MESLKKEINTDFMLIFFVPAACIVAVLGFVVCKIISPDAADIAIALSALSMLSACAGYLVMQKALGLKKRDRRVADAVDAWAEKLHRYAIKRRAYWLSTTDPADLAQLGIMRSRHTTTNAGAVEIMVNADCDRFATDHQPRPVVRKRLLPLGIALYAAAGASFIASMLLAYTAM